MNLVLAIHSAASAFHDPWRPNLGLAVQAWDSRKRTGHGSRLRAEALAEGWKDEYDTRRPIADLRKELVERIYVFVQYPVCCKSS